MLAMTGVAALNIQPVHQDAMAAAGADQANVGADALHPPLPGPARVLLAKRDQVTDVQLDGRQYHAPDSAEVAPVKAK